jgi:hypothetical protein
LIKINRAKLSPALHKRAAESRYRRHRRLLFQILVVSIRENSGVQFVLGSGSKPQRLMIRAVVPVAPLTEPLRRIARCRQLVLGDMINRNSPNFP